MHQTTYPKIELPFPFIFSERKHKMTLTFLFNMLFFFHYFTYLENAKIRRVRRDVLSKASEISMRVSSFESVYSSTMTSRTWVHELCIFNLPPGTNPVGKAPSVGSIPCSDCLGLTPTQLHLVLSWRQRMSQTSKGEKRKYPVVSVCDLFCSCLGSSTTLSKDRLRKLQRRQQRKPGPAVGPPERLHPLWVWKYPHKVCLFITGLFHLCL